MKLANSVVFITGANRGLGLAYAKAALAAGAKKVYAAAREASSITLPGVTPIALDITNSEQIAAAVAAAPDVTILINNAGISLKSDLLGNPDALANARAEFETNFYGPWALTAAFAPLLKANGGGAVVNVLSALTWISFPSVATYSASKSAAWSLTNGLRNALRAQGTLVTAVHVGYMDTDMTAGLDAPKASPTDVARVTFDGIEAGQFEVLADETSKQLKAGLSSATPPYAN